MELLPVSIVENWHRALNAADYEQVGAMTSDAIAHSEWLGFTAEPLRWFCGQPGVVVVEQLGCWLSPPVAMERIVASAFRVFNARIVRYRRFDELPAALAATSLSDDDEVLVSATVSLRHDALLTCRLRRAG